jgi:hypothetical protein
MELENIIQNDENSPKGYLIKNKQFINYLTKTINLSYQIRGNDLTFPAPQPVSLERKDYEKLQKYQYSVSLKLDGIRFLLYFIRDKNERNQCILINRALNFFSVYLDVDQSMFNGTLLDGELIYNKQFNRWDFSIHDAIILNGNKVNKLPHSVRLCDTRLCLSSFVNYYNDKNVFNMYVKYFYSFENFENFKKEIFDQSEDNDGVIFMPENLPVISGTQYSMLKWKPENKHTFDFLIKESEIGLQAFVFHMSNLKLFANIYFNTNEGKIFIENSKKLNNYKNECIIECTFDKKTNNFTPILIRTDKTHPNSLRTIERTLFNINENIQLEEFINLLQK